MENNMSKKSDKLPPRSFEDVYSSIMENQYKIDKSAFDKIKKLMRDLDPLKTASTFFGLSIIGSLQSNITRISNLAHASLMYCKGKKDINKNRIIELFKALNNSSIALDEDPTEDTFIALVSSKSNSFLVFRSDLESSYFFLERFIDTVDGMPNGGRYLATKRSVYALLKLSNMVAIRSGIVPNSITSEYPLGKIPSKDLLRPDVLRKKVSFTKSDLRALNIEKTDLTPFILSIKNDSNIPLPSHYYLTPLDRRPIIKNNKGKYYIFPSAIEKAIRSYILTQYTKTENDRISLTTNYIKSSQIYISKSILFGQIPMPPLTEIPQESIDHLIIQEFSTEVSKGRPLHLIFMFDCFNNWIHKDWISAEPFRIDMNKLNISKRIHDVKNYYDKKCDIKKGITVLVFSGWGRSAAAYINDEMADNWAIISLNIEDLSHLNDHPDMKPLHLWRIIEAENKLDKYGGKIYNINGFLNLFGWLVENNWHIIPHEQLPKENLPDGILITLPTNHIAYVRLKARFSKERRIVKSVDGLPINVIRNSSKYYFREDDNTPLYSSIDAFHHGKLLAVYIGISANWWISMGKPNSDAPGFLIWDAITHWMKYIDNTFWKSNIQIPKSIEWKITIDNDDINHGSEIVSHRHNECIVETIVKVKENGIFSLPDNSGETSMVKSFINELLTDIEPETIDNLMNSISPNKDAKFFHQLYAKTFTDYISDILPKPIIIERLDDANSRIGLGWIDDSKGKFIEIKGKKSCVSYLNKIVDKVWNKIKSKLLKYDKLQLCQKLSLNLESLRNSKSKWERTVKAALALHKDKENVIDTVNEQISKINAANIASRILIEMAACTSHINGAEEPDDLDISTLLAHATLIFNIGAWSDAIEYNLFEPSIHISSFGQVMLNYDFERNVIIPYHKFFNTLQRKSDAENYDKLYDQSINETPEEELFPRDFLSAWKFEFNISLHDIRLIIDIFEDYGLQSKKAVYKIKKSNIVEHIIKFETDFDKHQITKFIDRITLPSRPKWNQTNRELPQNFSQQDWYPWNFRRKLSVITRPIVELDNEPDPLLLISPSAIRESLWYLISNSLDATFDEKFYFSSAMKKWIGNRRNLLGNQFNDAVKDKMIEQGWDAESNILVTQLLNRKTDRDYGDIDVLAWSKKNKLLIAIECKDLYFAKTHKEIGRQLNDFKGVVNKKGKRDRLLKHFDRLNLISSYLSKIEKYTGISDLSHIFGLVVFSKKNVIEYAPHIPNNKIMFCALDSIKSPDEMSSTLIPWKILS